MPCQLLPSSSFIFFWWFLWVGGANIIPQAFFLDREVFNKESYLAALLVLGSCASILGIFTSNFIRVGRVLALSSYILASLTFLSLFFMQEILLFFLAYALFRFISCFMYNRNEIQLLTTCSSENKNSYSHISILLQLAAILLSPLYFSYYLNDSYTHGGIIASLLVIILLNVKSGPSFNKKTQIFNKRQKLKFNFTKLELSFLLYCTAFMAIVYLFSAQAVFFFHDYYQIEGAVELTGLVMFTTFLSAFITPIITRQFNISRKLNNQFHFPLSLLAIACLLLFLKLSDSIFYLLSTAVFIGTAYGIFMQLSKSYVVNASSNNQILSLYNVLPYFSTLIPFAIILFIRLSLDEIDYWHILFALFIAKLLIAYFYALKFQRHEKQLNTQTLSS